MDLKIRDISELLHISETTVRRWLREKDIPHYRLNQQYYFNRSEVEHWLLTQGANDLSLSTTHSHAEGPQKTTRGSFQFSLYRAINRGGVHNSLAGNTKEEIIRSTTTEIAHRLDLDADILANLLLEREYLAPTAINNGIAVPHTRDFLLPTSFDAITVVFPETPIEYEALDHQPVHTLFFIFACKDHHHLHLLSKIAYFCQQKPLLEFLKAKPSQQELLAQVKTWEGNFK